MSKATSRHRRYFGKLFGAQERKAELRPTIFSVGGDFLTSNKTIVLWWKEPYDGILKLPNTHSEKEAETEDFGLGSLIIGVKLAWACQQLAIPQISPPEPVLWG